MNFALIFAGGIGSRMGSEKPKQFLEVDGIPIIVHVLLHFQKHSKIDGIVIASKGEYVAYCKELCEKYSIEKLLKVVPGGMTGQGSIYNGLKIIAEEYSRNPESDIVLIHDGVRPAISEKLISDNIRCVEDFGNSITVAKAIETVIRIDDAGKVRETVDRSECRNAKAPQCFRVDDIWIAHKRALKDGITDSIDSATLMSLYGTVLHTVECGPENIKITTPNDYYMFRAMYMAEKKGEVL